MIWFFTILLAFVAAGGWVWMTEYKKNISPTPQNSAVEALPKQLPVGSKKLDFYTITTQQQAGEKVVSNTEEMVSVRTPDSWEVSPLLPKVESRILTASLSITEEGDEVESEHTDLIILKKDNPQVLSLEEWFKIRLKQFLDRNPYYKSHPTEYQSSEVDLNGNRALGIVTVEKDYSSQTYFAKGKTTSTIYEISCAVYIDNNQLEKSAGQYANDCMSILRSSLTLH